MVEQLICNHQVASSNLAAGTIISKDVENINIKFDLTASDYDKNLQFHLGNHLVLEVFKPYSIDYNLGFDKGIQTLDFTLANKTDRSSTITVSGLHLDDISVGHAFFENTKYYHNFNGNGKDTVDNFYGTMGCNGVAKFTFETPLYIWLLANN